MTTTLELNDRITIRGQQGQVCGLDRTGGKVWIKLDSGITIWAKADDATQA